jgi:small subunit ribosomal protein S17
MVHRRKAKVGYVTSNRMDKTVTVAVKYLTRHRLYKKLIRRQTKFKAHDESNSCQVGDKVAIVETRPLSKTKRWRVVEVLVTSQGRETELTELKEAVLKEDDTNV